MSAPFAIFCFRLSVLSCALSGLAGCAPPKSPVAHPIPSLPNAQPSVEEQVSSPTPPIAEESGRSDPCLNAQGWRQSVCAFARKSLVHAAWGYEHGLRDYSLAADLAARDHVTVDDDVLFAAAMLHDLGGFAPYRQEGIDHALRSAEIVGSVLGPAGFPPAKLEGVRGAILHHSYYDKTRPTTPEGVMLHDADGLDFLGAVAAMRILAIAGDPAAPDVASALKLLTSLYANVPSRIYGVYAEKLARERGNELRAFLVALARETNGFGVPRGRSSQNQ
jgi:HD superfamily phosphodiesterase